MQKLLRSSFLVVCTCFLMTISNAIANTGNNLVHNSVTFEQMSLVQNDVKVNDLDIEPINTTEVKKNVVPNTKQEGRKVAQLFLKTMLFVALSAVILYFILVFVKKFHSSAFMSQYNTDDLDFLDLGTPNTKNGALKSFLRRTR